MRRMVLRVVWMMALLLLPASLLAQELAAIPSLRSPVVDVTGTLDAGQIQQLEQQALALQQRKGAQLQILIVPTTQPEAIEQYTQRVFDQWKIGRKGVDDGVLLLVAKDDRRVRIQPGYGLEGAIPDITANRIIQEYLAPRFREGDYAGGIAAATATLAGLIEGEALPAPVSGHAEGGQRRGRRWLDHGAVHRLGGGHGGARHPGRATAPAARRADRRCRRRCRIAIDVVAVRQRGCGGDRLAGGPILRLTGPLCRRRRLGRWRLRWIWRRRPWRFRRRWWLGRWRRVIRRRWRLGELVMRWLRHLFAPSAQRTFPAACMDAIAAAVTASERSHTGQIMVAVEADLPLEALWRGHSARQRAEQAFAQLRTWDTEANNGVLIYLLLADHAIEVVADRGLRSRVPEARWAEVCRRMQQFLREGQHEAAVLAGIEAATELLAEHFPATDGAQHEDELPDRPRILG